MPWLGAVSLAAWIYLLAFRGGFWRMRAACLPREFGRTPRVAIVVPARNEAGLIGHAAKALVRQKYSGEFSTCVVDDHSADATAAEARDAGKAVTVVEARPLPPNWTGK